MGEHEGDGLRMLVGQEADELLAFHAPHELERLLSNGVLEAIHDLAGLLRAQTFLQKFACEGQTAGTGVAVLVGVVDELVDDLVGELRVKGLQASDFGYELFDLMGLHR